MYIYIYMYILFCWHTCIYTCMYTYMFIFPTRVCVCVYVRARCASTHVYTHMHKYIIVECGPPCQKNVVDVCCCCSYSDELMFDGRPAMETKNATLRKDARDPHAAMQPHQHPRIKHAIQQTHFNEQVEKFLPRESGSTSRVFIFLVFDTRSVEPCCFEVRWLYCLCV